MGKKEGPKFYQSEEFKKLNALWVTGQKSKTLKNGTLTTKTTPSKLQKSGFDDIEKANGSLKTMDIRTQAYQDREQLSRIASALSSFIADQATELTQLEKKILELHSQGKHRKTIMKITQKSHTHVWKIIKKYIPLALGLYASEEEE